MGLRISVTEGTEVVAASSVPRLRDQYGGAPHHGTLCDVTKIAAGSRRRAGLQIEQAGDGASFLL